MGARPERVVVIPTFDDGPLDREVWSKERKFCPSEQDFLRSNSKIMDVLQSRGQVGVFYVNGWGNVDLDTRCASRTEDALRAMFRKGVWEIYDRGHVIGLHSFDHISYRSDELTVEEIAADLDLVITELDDMGVPYYHAWRPPYGGHDHLQQQVKEYMGLSAVREWHISSNDWTTHDDSYLRISSHDVWIWFAKGGIGAGVQYCAPAEQDTFYNDILFHTNSYTARHLPELLDYTQEKLSKIKRADFSKTGNYYWMNSFRNPEVIRYMDPKYQRVLAADVLRD